MKNRCGYEEKDVPESTSKEKALAYYLKQIEKLGLTVQVTSPETS